VTGERAEREIRLDKRTSFNGAVAAGPHRVRLRERLESRQVIFLDNLSPNMSEAVEQRLQGALTGGLTGPTSSLGHAIHTR
jgi:hypothetical protein